MIALRRRVMGKHVCINCGEYKNCKDSFASWIFFIIGIIATIAIRVVTVLIHMNPVYAKIAWYVGISGFFLFFVYKYRVSQARSGLIQDQHIMDKVNKQEKLSANDYSLIGSILCGLSSRKERINYMVIFGLSAVAIALAVYMDFIR